MIFSNLKCGLICFFCLVLMCVHQVYAADNNPQSHFLALADIHFDPFVDCKPMKPCLLIQKLRKAPAQAWKPLLEKLDTKPPAYKEDSNYPLIKSALLAAKEAAEKYHIQFVLILGDFIGHDFRSKYEKYSGDLSKAGYQSFLKKTFQFLNHEIADTFPQVDVYAAVGNNDTYHADYSSQPNGAFFQETAILWSQLIKNQKNRIAMRNTFPVAGYYALDVPAEPRLRIIVLNSNLFSTHAKGKGLQMAAEEELTWLHRELVLAKARNQHVILAMHIPTGIDVFMTLRIRLFTVLTLWQEKYLKRFNNEIETFSSNIVAIFAGHLHSDWFQILTFKNSTNEIPETGVPAISPIFGNNPGFKIYNYSSQSLQLQNFITYYYPLNEDHTWRAAYDFNRVYLPHCEGCPMVAGMKLLEQKNHLAKHYQKFYSLGTDNQPITFQWLPYYWCAIHHNYVEEYTKCIR